MNKLHQAGGWFPLAVVLSCAAAGPTWAEAMPAPPEQASPGQRCKAMHARDAGQRDSAASEGNLNGFGPCALDDAEVGTAMRPDDGSSLEQALDGSPARPDPDRLPSRRRPLEGSLDLRVPTLDNSAWVAGGGMASVPTMLRLTEQFNGNALVEMESGVAPSWLMAGAPQQAALFSSAAQGMGGGASLMETTPVPEPHTWAMLLAGCAMLAGLARRKN